MTSVCITPECGQLIRRPLPICRKQLNFTFKGPKFVAFCGINPMNQLNVLTFPSFVSLPQLRFPHFNMVQERVIAATLGILSPQSSAVGSHESKPLNSELCSEEITAFGTEKAEVQGDDREEEKETESDGQYAYELKVATQAVQLACQLSRRIQERIRLDKERIKTKKDKSLVTVADWGVQAVVSWVLSQSFPDAPISMVAEEDTEALRGRSGIEHLGRVVTAVNECLAEGGLVGIAPPMKPLSAVDVLQAIQRGTSSGGTTGRHWILDPVDGTLGFVRGDQYAIALAMMDSGKVVLGVLGCPNLPTRMEWLRYPHRYHRIAEKMFPPPMGAWYRGCVIRATKGGSGVWMEPLAGDFTGKKEKNGKRIHVSDVEDPSKATFCEPVEKANTSQEFSEGVAKGIGLSNQPLRVYSMAKYAAIARGDAEIFMKFAKVGYKEKIWDHAAGVLLVEEAGGVVTDAGGRPLDFSKGRFLEGLDRGIVASCNKKLHDRLLGSVDDSWESSIL